MAPTKTELIDLFWRAFWTAIQAFSGGVLAAGAGVVDITALEAGMVAAVGAVLSLMKTYASNQLGMGTAGDRATPVVGPQPVASRTAIPSGER